jgi:hypothetical protein
MVYSVNHEAEEKHNRKEKDHICRPKRKKNKN